MSVTAPNFPGGSKERVNRAGDAVRAGTATEQDFDVINTWRAAHRAVLNTFQAILRNRTRGQKIAVAQRHKRRSTIFDKLERLPGMRLARMDDVAGCRLIFDSVEALYAFRETLHAAHFGHELKNSIDKYDYIKRTKDTGYRGVHDVFAYDVNSDHGKPYKGLLIELQYRTNYQHAWATAVEVIGFITESQPKFKKGDKRYEDAMSLASEIIARAYENGNASHPDLSNSDLISTFLAAEKALGLLGMLRSLNAASKDVSEKKNVILIFGAGGDLEDLETISYRDATDALRALFQLEKERPGRDVVLVRAETSEEVRFAFKNYFSDAREFIELIEGGCQKLAGNKVIYGPEIIQRGRGRKGPRPPASPGARNPSAQQ
jgi:ppGpp synthetase/RelA/SpoT-type nucleotidyltranferase